MADPMRSLGFVFVVSLGACVGSDPAPTPASPAPDGDLPGSSSSSSSSGGPSSSDGGSEGGATNAPTIGLRTEVADVVVREGAETTVKVLLTRTRFKDAVSITASGFNTGVTVAPLEIGAGGVEGTLTIKAGVGAAHGISALSIKAVGEGVADETAELKLLVRSAPGTFDNSFGTGGKATGSGGVTGLALQPDGKLVVVGNAATETFVARHTPDGKPDLSFGGTGRIILPSPISGANDVVVRADGKIFVACNQPSGNTPRFAVTRLSENGTIDSGFGVNGTRAFSFNTTSGANATSIGLDAVGNVIVSGYRFDGTAGEYNFAVLRLTGDDGHFDTKFSGDGFDDIDFGGAFDMGYGLAVKPDGTVVIAGGAGAPNAFSVTRLLPGGTPDVGLNGNGQAMRSFPSTSISVARAVVNQPDNKMVLAGYLTPNGGFDEPVIARFEAGGGPDASFGSGGATTTSVSAGHDQFASVALQTDGAIVVAGFTQSGAPATSQFLLARYTVKGVLDTTFTPTGLVKTSFNGEGDVATRVVLQADGRILVAGKVGSSNYGIARFWP